MLHKKKEKDSGNGAGHREPWQWGKISSSLLARALCLDSQQVIFPKQIICPIYMLSVKAWCSIYWWRNSFSFIFFLTFIYFWERDRQSVSGGGAEIKGDTESEAGSRLWAVSTAPDVGLEITDCKIMTWAEVGCSTELSHPDAPIGDECYLPIFPHW